MKIAIQSECITPYGIEKGYRMAAEAGFEAIDFSIYTALKISDVKKAEKLEGLTVFEKDLPQIMDYFKEELDAMKKNGLTITQAHAPFPPDVVGRPEVLDYSIMIYKNIIAFCKEIGCPRLVIHGITRGDGHLSLTQEEIDKMNLYLFESLIPTLLENEGVMVCLENLFADIKRLGPGTWAGVNSNPVKVASMIDQLNEKAGKEVFGFCLDTGHLNLERIAPCDYIPVIGKRLVCLHIHDNMQLFDSHLLPYTGNIYWNEVLNELKNIGYDLDLNFETFMQFDPLRLPKELAPAFLKCIFETGRYFKDYLEK